MSETATNQVWHQVSSIDDLWEGEMTSVDIDGTPVLVVNADGDVHALRNRCPHQNWPLHDGDFSNGVLTCAQHLWTFDVVTGKGVNPSSCALHKFGCKVDEDGNIYVSIV